MAVTVTEDPTSVSAPAGSVTTFTADAAGEPAPTVAWEMSVDGGLGWARVHGARLPTLTVEATPETEDSSMLKKAKSRAASILSSSASLYREMALSALRLVRR